MTTDPTADGGPGRRTRIALWIVKGLMALVFLYAGGAKLLGTEKMVTEFGHLGFGQGFRYLTGVIEVVAVILLFVPRMDFYGGVLLMGICGGAFISQIAVLHNDVIHTVVLGLMALAVTWFGRPAWLFRNT